MPELPEVETVRLTLLKLIKGEEIENITIRYKPLIEGDVTSFSKQLLNQTFDQIERRGKYLLFIFNEIVMTIHLRMEGKFYIKTSEPYEKHEHVIFHLKSGKTLRYHDVRKFGRLAVYHKNDLEQSKALLKLGPEPKDHHVNDLYQSLTKRKIAIKTALLNQSIIAGLGNIYVDETLFRSQIHPTRRCQDLTKKEVSKILEESKKVLEHAIKLGGTTIRSYTSTLGVHGRFQNELLVHMKKGEPCPICAHPIEKMVVGGRGTYVCPKCQK
jgi:formamidopyrimidine-DNA glycosylase